MRASPLPAQLPPEFCTSVARELGVTDQRLRARDLERPFRGVRMRPTPPSGSNPFRQAEERELAVMRALATRLDRGQFFCRRSAALLWGAPLRFTPKPELHIGVIAPQRTPRIRDVAAHSFTPERAVVTRTAGLLLTTPAVTFATLGSLPLAELVAVGDNLVRVHRAGYGRPNADKPPLATIAQLAECVALGRWRGMPTLRRALDLIREDSWSPRESTTRLTLVLAGLPEPELNVDVFDESGLFLGCLDMAYVRYKVGVEYHGGHHAETFANDVERIERLRAAGWEMIQTTKALDSAPSRLVSRVAEALRARGWPG